MITKDPFLGEKPMLKPCHVQGLPNLGEKTQVHFLDSISLFPNYYGVTIFLGREA